MTDAEQTRAWNNLVLHASPDAFEKGDRRRAAAIACRYMAVANNGGLNSFLTNSWDLDTLEVVSSLEMLGANTAARQLRHLLDQLDDPLRAMTQDERWNRLDELWKDELDALDMLTDESERDLVAALEKHLSRNFDYYLSIADGNTPM